MRYRQLGSSDLSVSEVCLGTMTFGWTCDERTSHTIMDAARDAGITFIDTADIYSSWSPNSYAGKTEEIIGRWLRNQPRDSLIVATKVRGPMRDERDQGLSRERIMRCVDDSLRRLQTDYIDLYQTHWPDDDVPIEETLRAFDDLIRDGKLRAIGCSNESPDHLRTALRTSTTQSIARFISLQPHYNLVHRAEFEAVLRGICEQQGLGVIPYSPLAGGFLTGKYRRGQEPPKGSRGETSSKIQQYLRDDRAMAVIDELERIGQPHGKTIGQVALAWLIDAPAVTAPIVGASSLSQLNESLGAIGTRLADDDRQRLNDLSAGL